MRPLSLFFVIFFFRLSDLWVGDGFSKGGESVGGVVNCPGDLGRAPKGWEMPEKARPMKIGVPARPSFDNFVKVVKNPNDPEKLDYSGFCIELFFVVLEVLNINGLVYNFVPHYETYDDLVDHVSNKTYYAIVGDVTILASRMEHVEFTQPYAESGLSMIVVKSKEPAWIFLKPFSLEMWVVTALSLLYTVFIVWFLEHRSNSVFKQGSWKDQIGNAFWFTFSSVFYAHRETVESKLTKVVVVVWFFLVMVLTSSYTASLSSMLTVQGLESPITIESLKKSNAIVGCDGDSFVRDYLKNALGFNDANIMNVDNQDKYDDLFKNGSISAAFLELPYEKVFINQNCKGYIATAPTYRFGGLSFVFQKGSPLTKNFSKAILKLSENGTLKQLEDKWFRPATQCSTDNINHDNTQSLNLHSFWGLYVFSGATSTVCLLIFTATLLFKYRRDKAGYSADAKVWNKVADFARYFYAGEVGLPVARAPTLDEWSSSLRWEYESPEDTLEYRREFSLQGEVEMLPNAR